MSFGFTWKVYRIWPSNRTLGVQITGKWILKCRLYGHFLDCSMALLNKTVNFSNFGISGFFGQAKWNTIKLQGKLSLLLWRGSLNLGTTLSFFHSRDSFSFRKKKFETFWSIIQKIWIVIKNKKGCPYKFLNLDEFWQISELLTKYCFC